jgi:hypothetical protein
MSYIVKKIEKKVYINNNRYNIILNVKKEKSLTYCLFLKNSEKVFFLNLLNKKMIKGYLKESGVLK